MLVYLYAYGCKGVTQLQAWGSASREGGASVQGDCGGGGGALGGVGSSSHGVGGGWGVEHRVQLSGKARDGPQRHVESPVQQ